MFSFKAIRKPVLDTMIFRHCHKNLWVVVSVFIFLLFILPSFHYFSSYTSTSNILKVSPLVHDDDYLSHHKPYVVEETEEEDVDVDDIDVEDHCLGRYVYMYDLPARFNSDLVTNCRQLCEWFDFCPYLINNGFGPLINQSFMSGESWYATNQFMLSVIFHSRMKQYECLTDNSTLASAIYAPFYPGLEIGRHLFGGHNASTKDAEAVAFAEWLSKRPEWERMLGRDHFFVAGRITWDFRRLSNFNSDWGSKLLNLPEVKNMTMLTIESSPYGNNDFAIPYPTYFHPSKDNEVFAWQEKVKTANRSYLYAFGGAPRPNDTESIRGELIDQCKNSPSQCNLVSCTNDANCNRPERIIEMFMQSDFCLQPPGDSSTRRSTFDSILAGCIPVFFHPGSAYVQYLWHLPNDFTRYSVFIPMEAIKNGSVSVEDVLSKIAEDDVVAMRDEVISLIPKIIYATRKLEKIEDAFDIAVKQVLERIDGFQRQISDGIDPSPTFPENASWKYYLTGSTDRHEWDSYFGYKGGD